MKHLGGPCAADGTDQRSQDVHRAEGADAEGDGGVQDAVAEGEREVNTEQERAADHKAGNDAVNFLLDDRRDAEDQEERADGLRHADDQMALVRDRRHFAAEHAPEEHREECAEELCRDVAAGVLQLDTVNTQESDRHGRVDVRATDRSERVHE